MDWHEFFDEDAHWLYATTLDAERTEHEVASAVRLLGLREGHRVADLGCGTGRHAVALARRGLRVTGVDGSTSALTEARRAAERVGVSASFVEADLRRLPLETEHFDAAVSLFSSIGYGGDASAAQVLSEAARALVPGGRLLVEVLGRDQAVRTFHASRDWSLVDGCVVRVTRWIDLVRGEECARFEFDRGAGPREKMFRRRLFTPTELEALLLNAGFSNVRFFGDYEGNVLGLDSPGLLAVARKGTP